ncbi:chromosome segregation protein SMC [Solitalea koreensis]|uniref:Chromosome partition protein Smc n=1 Tax=Solitalea koreensis TaxID=543615 RepID=A0A521BQ42_9SPHI|nr:chromosome segregation protein SMC [Solitalea koreensis]SMO49278.1 condensin subunit Smc [Solitalea koreensis]
MKLTRLEIRGFKSFGDKITINFDEGVTAIVGPNGCGKSNVVDAIRWVLGEQSAKYLRSEKMENIIFNGTRSRKPSNLAEVSLTFDNTKNILPTDFSQVTITRKLYRTGESEYRLNEVTCRLKDITDLFLDTGIGPDSYSIIELKMIEEMLNNKDGSRRNLFEEASGISKYKIRKKQTFNKLRDTEADLNRVEDILFEIEKQLKTLEYQAKKTERYYRLKDQYKELSTQLATFRIHTFKTSFDDLEKHEIRHTDEKMAFQAESDKVEARLQEEKTLNLIKEKNLSIQQKATNDYVNGIRQYENEKKVKNEQLKFLQEKESRLSSELTNDRSWLDNAKETLVQLEESRAIESERMDAIQKILNELKFELEDKKTEQDELKTQVDSLTAKGRSLQDEVYKIEKERDILEIQSESLQQELNRNANDTQTKQLELDEFNTAIKQAQEIYSAKEQELNTAVADEETLQQTIKDIEVDLQQTKDRISQEGRTLDAKQNEYNLTKSLVDNLEGYPESIKFLRKNASWAKNAPLLSDVFFCKEEYRIAIENYLEPYMNYYVVQNHEEALTAIKLLSDAARGRANFFVLDAFANYEEKETSAAPDNCIPALSIIDSEDKYRKLCSFLLNNVFMAEKEEENTIKANSGSDLVLLSKSGKYAKARFSMAGGSVGLFEGKRIGRAKNLEVLQKDINKLQSLIAELKNKTELLVEELQKLKASTKTSLINQLRQEINKLNSELITLEARQEQHRTFISNSNLRREDIELKINSYTKQLAEINPQIEELLAQREDTLKRLNTQQYEFNILNETVTKYASNFNQQNINFHQQQNKLSVILKDVEYKSNQQRTAQERIEKNSIELSEAKAKISVLLQTTDDNDDGLLAMYEQKDAMEKALNEAEEDYYKSKGQINELESLINELRRKKDNVETLVNQYREKKTQLMIEINSMKERLSVEFGIDIEDLSDSVLPEEPEDELKQRNDKVKNQLDNFGAINPMAMEAYNEMNERFLFILAQKKDLIDAKNSLMETITEIDNTAKTQFFDAFTQIRNNFQKVFRSLFNEEDSCDLILADPNDPLESDIEIIARPKGKRPLTINQLSGGEKTLTATAILFSLYLLKPAPFCIFDEVDAPLDDTNIDKFNNIIRKFSDQSQFIIVSHNKRTIASTDVIYGVTMVEQGISRVVPVDMRSVEVDNVA